MLWGQPIVDVDHHAIGLVGKPYSVCFMRVQISHNKAATMKIDQGVERPLGTECFIRPNDLNRNVVLNAVGRAVNGALFNEALWKIGLGVEESPYISGAFSADWAAIWF